MPSTSSQLQAKCTLKKASIYFSSQEAWGEVGKEEGERGVGGVSGWKKKEEKRKAGKKEKKEKLTKQKSKKTKTRFVKTRRRIPWLWANSAREWESVQGERSVSSCRSHLAMGTNDR